MNYEETLLELHNTPRLPKEKNLNRMRMLMEMLGNPETELSLIHVAGTNGKGSISRMLEEVLFKSGYKTGLFTSPFIFDFRERIQINNEMISKDKVVYYYKQVENACCKVVDQGQRHPSEFEVVVAMCLLYFRDEKVDIGIIEVGIGGLYDATNIIHPVLSVITSITFDHMAILGKSLIEIAAHKAGIIKDSPTVSSSQHPEVRKVLVEKAKSEGSRIVFASSKDVTFLSMEGKWQKLKYELPGRPSIIVNLNLLGIHQMLNCGVVLLAVEELRTMGFLITEDHVKKALEEVKWPGRMEMISSKPLIIVDGAHNMDGAINLRESMEFYFREREIILILGILGDKDVESIAGVLTKGTKITICITPQYYRGKKSKELYEMIKDKVRAEPCDTYDDAVARSLELYKEGDIILVAGSLYTIGDMEKAFKAHL